MAVMIGVDPHKASHTAVALDESEQPLGELRVRSAGNQIERLLEWAAPFTERVWAVEVVGGLGCLLAQQLVAVGERGLMCHRSWPLGCGCWLPVTATRTTPTMPVRWRSPRCAQRSCVRCTRRITRW